MLAVGVRKFIKAYLSEEHCLGLKCNDFKGDTELISFIYGYD